MILLRFVLLIYKQEFLYFLSPQNLIIGIFIFHIKLTEFEFSNLHGLKHLCKSHSQITSCFRREGGLKNL